MTPIDQRLQKVFREAFENDGLQVNDSLSAAETAEWDSLAQIKLIVGLEEEFGIKFSTDEITQANSVPALKRVILRHLSG